MPKVVREVSTTECETFEEVVEQLNQAQADPSFDLVEARFKLTPEREGKEIVGYYYALSITKQYSDM